MALTQYHYRPRRVVLDREYGGLTERRYADGPAMWRQGKPARHLPGVSLPDVRATVPTLEQPMQLLDDTDTHYAIEAYRMRNRPHLYGADTWHDQILDWREQLAERADLYDWDCHRCQRAVFTRSIEDRCPNCLTA